MRQFIYQAMHQSDDLVVEFDDTDAKGVATHRVVTSSESAITNQKTIRHMESRLESAE